MKTKEELIAERNALASANLQATSWGAAMGARHERIQEIERELRSRNFTPDKHSDAKTPGLIDELAAWLCALEDADMYKPIPDSLVEHGRRYIHAGKTEKHSGDCTKESHTCVVCSAGSYLLHAKQILVAIAPGNAGAMEGDPPPFGEGGFAGRMERHAKQFKDHKGTVELTVTPKEIRQIADALAPTPAALDPVTVEAQIKRCIDELEYCRVNDYAPDYTTIERLRALSHPAPGNAGAKGPQTSTHRAVPSQKPTAPSQKTVD